MSDTPWYDTLPGIWARVWAALSPGMPAHGPADRLATLATLDAGGTPALRQLVIRDSDEATATIELHTDAASHKAGQIARNPAAALLLWSPGDAMQIRVTGQAKVLSGAAVADRWAGVPETSRGNYGVTPAPGTPIAHPDAFSRTPDPARFAILRLTAQALDVVVLSEPTHRRATFTAADGWAGTWCAP